MKNQVYKFGGSSTNTKQLFENTANIIVSNKPRLVVISAIGKTTNALETIVNEYFIGNSYSEKLEEVKQFHAALISKLFEKKNIEAFDNLDKIITYCTTYLEHSKGKSFDEVYDQIIPAGELLSSKILELYLKAQHIEVNWLDARKILQTDNRFREALPDINTSSDNLNTSILPEKINLIQGFIGGTLNNLMTTIGREGSDYSAALFANFIDADKLVVWKDVDGVLNADPRYFNDPKLIAKLSYKDAIELSYYGATIIHPKTIQPLAKKNIPLQVRSFKNSNNDGTLINSEPSAFSNQSIYIYKPHQLLITLETEDLTFFGELEMQEIYSLLFEHKLEVNLVQNSAVKCSFSINNDSRKFNSLITKFSQKYKVRYNKNLNLLTVRNYQSLLLEDLLKGKEILIEQKTRTTLKLLFK